VKSTRLLVLAAVLVTGCATGPQREARPLSPTIDFERIEATAQATPDLLLPPTEPFRIGVGDLIEIEVLELGGTRRVVRVMPDGLIYYDLLRGFRAEGLTMEELKVGLEKELTAHYRSPQVGLILRGVNSKKVWVMGRVNTPGLYALNQPSTVLEALARAGGLFTSRFSGTTEELADLKHSFLVRDGELMPVDFYKLLREGDLSQNIYLRSGDYIYLPSALSQQIYVLGAVNKPRSVGFMDQVTLVSSIASAFDVTEDAYAERVLIVRGRFTEPQVAVVDYQAILQGRRPDVALEPGDIVWVPDSPWYDLQEYAKTIVTTFVRSVAAREGSAFAVPAGESSLVPSIEP
jgi:polysaccharide biosynthesis/export protein